MSKPDVSVLLPVYNEAGNLDSLVARINASLRKANLKYEIIAIDDHSSDDSVKILKTLAQSYPLTWKTKKGEQGKAFSLLEAAEIAQSDLLCMIDADGQYPPEIIPEMVAQATTHGVIVANRISYGGSLIRRIGSKCISFIFGRLLHGLQCDMQSGLKVFRKSILHYLPKDNISAWSFDLPLLHTALELGHSIGEVSIVFDKRQYGESKLTFFKPTLAIAQSSIKLKRQNKLVIPIEPNKTNSMLGAGLIHGRKTFITHTTLHHQMSAVETFTRFQKKLFVVILMGVALGLIFAFWKTAIFLVGLLSFIYFIDVIFNFFLILKSLHSPPEIAPSKADLAQISDNELPVYTILCPLYKEAHILPHFLHSISKLDWPTKKLDVILLFEEDDQESIEAVKDMQLPAYVRVVVVPHSMPKTKPKACNYGLGFAKGEFVVIYDAEDQPDPQQLKTAYYGFKTVGPNIKCLQGKLNYYNPNQNWLTRFFTAEYSLWFDVILTGLQSIETTIPLGGTSNHFRRTDLVDLQGWDPFNVTEDCDLGIRLFKRGYQTAIIDSTTLEEANSNLRNWIRQRSRWIKGYMQTYLIHMREPMTFARNQGFHALLFQLTVGGKLAFILINPILWFVTILYFSLYAYVGPTIESFYPGIVFYMAVTSLIFGNFMFIYYYMIGCAKREHWTLMKWIYFIPFYWLMVSYAGYVAFYQLLVKPHYWEKTVHGLHLKKKQITKESRKIARELAAEVITEGAIQQSKGTILDSLFNFTRARLTFFGKHYAALKNQPIRKLIDRVFRSPYREGVLLVLANIAANLLNMGTNFYLGRELHLSEFAIVNTYMSLVYLISIPFSALSTTINHQTAHLLGKQNSTSAKLFWQHLSRRATLLAIFLLVVFILLLPTFTDFFKLPDYLPLILFLPIVVTTLFTQVNEGYLRGRLMFGAIAAATIIEPVVRFALTILVAESRLQPFVYVSIPIASLFTMIVSYYYARKGDKGINEIRSFRLPYTFFLLALIARLSSIAFFSLDNVIVAHTMSLDETGKYGLLGLVGKMIYFAGNLTASFILPIVAHREGRGESSHSVFKKLFALTLALSLCAYVAFGILLPLVAPYLFGSKVNAISSYLPIYCLAILFFTLSQTVVSFHLAKKHYIFAVISFGVALLQVVGLLKFHNSLTEVVITMFVSSLINAVAMLLVHWKYKKIHQPLVNFVSDVAGLFEKIPKKSRDLPTKDHYRILMFNWRDTKHVWAGGAEQYIHQIAKQLSNSGHHITLFCGNDGKHPRNEVVDGIQIIRRGGSYTVYFWAAIYYVMRLHKYFDIVVDCENGIPFLTPLYVRQPLVLLVHHIHQEVFRTQLRFPFSEIAALLESDVMPLLYRGHTIITVSESSKNEIIKLGLGNTDTIDVVNPGIETKLFKKTTKTNHPSFIYIGRLKSYKRVDIALTAFSIILKKQPNAILTIAGNGEELENLKTLALKLEIADNVQFLTDVDDALKAKLLAENWIAIQPSSVEGWGITVIESNAAGTPVIAANVNGLRDSVVDKETGILVDQAHPKAFANALEYLLDHPSLLKKMSQDALELSHKYDWAISAQRFCNALEHRMNQKIVLVKPGIERN